MDFALYLIISIKENSNEENKNYGNTRLTKVGLLWVDEL